MHPTRSLPAPLLPVALSLLAPMLLGGCQPPPDEPTPDAGFQQGCVVEGNAPLDRGLDTAVPLALNVEVADTLCPQRDNDGYRITVGAPESVIVVTLSMTTNITPIEPIYEIVRDNGDGTSSAIGTGEDPLSVTGGAGHITAFTGFHRVELAGDYIIIVRDRDGFDDGFDNLNAYTLTANVVPDPDANEPNNLAEQAAPISAGSTTGIIATVGDEDWYAIEAPGNAQIIDITITAPEASGVEHVATLLLNDALTVLQTEQLTAGPIAGQVTTRIRQRVTGIAGTPFLLRIEDGGDDGDLDSNIDAALASYTVELAVLADPDANEGALGNDAPETPTVVNGGSSVTAALASFNDEDIYKITPPGGTSRTNPGVLVVTITFDGTLDAAFKPQVRILTGNPEESPIAACAASCAACYDGKCGEARLQRFIQTSPFKTAYPLRNTEPLFVSINEFNDDAFQETGGYTISFQLADDGDAGEVGDDFLIPNLEEAGYANGEQLAQQRDESKQAERARAKPAGLPAVCPDGAPAAGCLDLVSVAVPNTFFSENSTVDCGDADAAPRTINMTGRLTYEGDRDYFLIPDFPNRGYYAISIDFSLDRASPVELAIFVHGFNGGALFGSTLVGAEETGTCTEAEGGQNACAPGSICVDERCWSDGPANAAISDTFGDDECVVAFEQIARPVYIEVVDNGINDFDLDMNYSLNVSVVCGCPAACDGGQDFCQDG